MSDPIYSIQVEKHALSGLLKYADSIFSEIDTFVSEQDFYQKEHGVIFTVIKSVCSYGGKIDKVLLSQKIKDLGISSKGEVSIFDYISALSFSQITSNATKDAFKELVKFRIRRELADATQRMNRAINTMADKSIDEIIAETDKIYNEKVQIYNAENKPGLLFENIEQVIESRAKSPKEETGLITPYSYFNKAFGGIRPGNLYAYVSRSGVGKSTVLNDLACKTAILNNCKALILDTENLTEDIKFRMAAAITGVPVWYLETGNFGRNEDLVRKYQVGKGQFEQYRKLVYHFQVAARPIEEIVSTIRRWYFKEVGRGNKCIVVYDYIKLTGENDYNKKEYEIIGEKVNRLKELSVELDIPILTANQLNRSAEAGIEDSSAISQSDRLMWYASFVAMFRRKNLDEIADDGQQFGTHKMIVLKSRHQGAGATGHQDLIRVPKTKGKGFEYKPNYISYDIQNFNVEEKGDLRAIIEAKAAQVHLHDAPKTDGQLL